ncbi:MAG: aspartate kinase, partial [Spirochaetota bacterium]
MAGFVCKFGGSSVADADQIKKIEKIIKQDPRRRYIVLSAPGKRHPGDQKITDMLYQCQELAGRGQDITGTFAGIKQRYLDIAAELRVKDEIEGVLDEIQQNIQSGASRDYAASRGEYLCARMMARYLGAAFIESAKYIRLTSRGGVDQYTYGLLAEKIKGEGMYVIPGFYGGGPDGEVRTFSRGGSDITGAIVARAAGADLYENWTDVSGLLMTDPGIVEAPRPIPEATYREIRELGACGAKVLHEEAIVPLYDQGIPIAIKNTNQPGHPGTTIVETRDTKEAPVAGIAGSTGFRLLTAEKMLMGKEGYREKLLDLVNQSNIGPVQMSVGVDSV